MCVCFKRHIGIVQVGRVVHWWAKMKKLIKLRFVKCINAFFRAQFLLQYSVLKHCGAQVGPPQHGPPPSESLHPPKHHSSVDEVD